MNIKADDAYPLKWPLGWKRTSHRIRSDFKNPTFGRARDSLLAELKRFKAFGIVLSTNIPLKRDGLPYANVGRIEDPGVAIYFKLTKALPGMNKTSERSIVLACDQYVTVEENAWALVKGIEALRGLKRWGVSEMLERAFDGFAALPAPIALGGRWYEVLGVDPKAAPDTVKAKYRELCKDTHPDRGGDSSKMARINEAWGNYLAEVGL
jgi:hypothetical protein